MEGCFLKEWVQVSLSFSGLQFHLSFQLSQLTIQASEQLYGKTVMQNTFLTRHYLSWKKTSFYSVSSRQSGFDEDHKRST